ncbi:MAG: site-specific integrase [Humidesulfovibrio sp.]|uniref:tyrosine-type recombinase/integrase n=1 Tax=Humidesulfovibrio sp. TaxID=2910988 RepID=UPI0027365D3F|nr:site-specific integrase [Humidesulfovibrio sp.]MDP2848473.1 site-specific integrase [Humidesulfovibrio sp.]
MAKVLFQERGGYFIAYRIPGSRKLIREYFGTTEDGKNRAKVRLAEIALMKAKGETLRDTSSLHLDQLSQHYLNDAKVRGAGARWRKEFARLLNMTILPALCSRPVDQLTYPDMLALTHSGGPWADKSTPTVNRYLGYLRSVFRFGIAQGLTTKNPLSAWRKTPERKKDVHLTVEDLRRIIAVAEPHLAWALEVEWALGTRPGVSELFSIRWADIDFEALTVHVRGTKTEGSNRTIPITPDFRARLLVVRQEAQSAYIIEYLGKPIKQLRRSLTTACRRAGITYGVRMYDVRHLFASAMLTGGADLAAVSALLGHSDISTTQKHYYHLMQGEKERAIATLPPIAAPKAGKLVKIK